MVEDVRRAGMRRFEGQSVIVTGGARGIGAATAARFLSEGANVLIMDVSQQHITGSHEHLSGVAREYGGAFLARQGDVTDPTDVDGMAHQALDVFGRIDVLVDNAGIAAPEPFLDISLDRWRRMIDINLTGMFLVAQRIAREMVRERHGTILLTSSTNGLVGEDQYAHYNASKGGVTLLTKSMAISSFVLVCGPKSTCAKVPGCMLRRNTLNDAILGLAT